MNVDVLDPVRCRLGEGPVWDAQRGCLFWVDSLAPALFRHDSARAAIDRWDLPGRSVGSLAVCDSGALLLAMDLGIYRFDPVDAALDCLAQPLAGREGVRFNDGKVDPYGNFVVGAMHEINAGSTDCALYRYRADHEIETLLQGFFCCNGPCFSADGETFYVAGRREGIIEVFDYADDASPRYRRDLPRLPDADGATLDADGFLWSAQWEAGCLLRIAPDGDIDHRIDLPGQVVSSLMFGGPELDLIYVTTLGCEYYGARPESARAGNTLVISDSGFHGLPEPVFRD